jgi:ADP-ribosylglycohydrolase
MSAEVTHNHPEGIKGAQAVAAAIFLTRLGFNKAYIKDYIENTFGYDLSSRTIEEQTPTYRFYVSCQRSVPQSIQCWLESSTYEETIRKAVYMGGDTDTMAAIAGSIAAATPGMEVPDKMVMAAVNARWPENGNEMIDIINEFHSKYEV